MPSGGRVHDRGWGDYNTSLPQAGGSSFFSNLNYGNIATGFGMLLSGGQRAGAGKAARDVAYANAADMLALAGENAARMQQIAGINAAAIRKTGYANAANVERTAYRNGFLQMIEGAEILRRHVRQERYMVGDIRARQAATGWSVNEGTLVLYKDSQKQEMFRERKYIANQQKLSLFTMLMNAEDQADTIRYGADQQAGALLASAAIEKEIMLSEAQAQYRAMMREGDLLARAGKSGTSGIGYLAGTVAGSFIPGLGPVGSAIGGTIGDALEGALF